MSDGFTPVTLTISVRSDEGLEDDRVDAATRRLRQQLTDFDVDSAQLARGDTLPDGAKSGEAIALGTVLVTMMPAVLPKVAEFLQAWMLRAEGRSVKIHASAGGKSFELEYVPGSTSEEELKRMMAAVSQSLQPWAQVTSTN